MSLHGRLLLSLWLLLAACDSHVYVGRDAPMALQGSGPAGAAALPAETSAEPLDSGVTQPLAAPAPPQMEPEPAKPSAPICEAQKADCDLDPSNGCEVDLLLDRNHCGACATACHTPDCSCKDGKLALNCDSQHADCDADINNGCETDLTNSMQHCGACQRACHTMGHDVTNAMCVAGRCNITCEPRVSPEQDCDGNPDNGCETYLLFDAKHCGMCGNSCVSGSCNAGACAI